MLTKHLVLDAGAFISGAGFYSMGPDVHYVTSPAVLGEIRDQRSNHFLTSFPYKIDTKQPSPESLRFICDFSKESGEFFQLSATDLEILALTYQMEIEEHGEDNLTFLPTETSGQVDWESSTPVKPDPQEDSQEDSQDDAQDDSEDDWITPDNIKTHQDKALGLSPSLGTEEHSTVACITTDYAMQNVMARLGLRLISVDGKAIKRLLFWSFGCYGCRRITSDLSRSFCPFCGGHTLTRVSTRIDPVTKETFYVWIKTKKLTNKRGTKYSIGKRKSGRHAENIILREDQLEEERAKRFGNGYKSKDGNGMDRFEDAVLWGTSAYDKAKASPMDIKYGPGRRNPNESLKVKKKNSRNRRRK